MLDLGTGSGVLAIAAAKAGLTHVKASDNDPVALDVAKANANLNGVAHRLSFIQAAGFQHACLRPPGHFDPHTGKYIWPGQLHHPRDPYGACLISCG